MLLLRIHRTPSGIDYDGERSGVDALFPMNWIPMARTASGRDCATTLGRYLYNVGSGSKHHRKKLRSKNKLVRK